MLDIEKFRTEDEAVLLERVYEKPRIYFKVNNYLISTKPWKLFMLVEMGFDRIQ